MASGFRGLLQLIDGPGRAVVALVTTGKRGALWCSDLSARCSCERAGKVMAKVVASEKGVVGFVPASVTHARGPDGTISSAMNGCAGGLR